MGNLDIQRGKWNIIQSTELIMDCFFIVFSKSAKSVTWSNWILFLPGIKVSLSPHAAGQLRLRRMHCWRFDGRSYIWPREVPSCNPVRCPLCNLELSFAHSHNNLGILVCLLNLYVMNTKSSPWAVPVKNLNSKSHLGLAVLLQCDSLYQFLQLLFEPQHQQWRAWVCILHQRYLNGIFAEVGK